MSPLLSQECAEAIQVRSLVCGLDPALRPRWRFTVINAYVDDSGSDRQGPAYILTGYTSDVDSWSAFTKDWKAALMAAPTIDYFRMWEAERAKEQFEGWPEKQITAKIHVLIPIINRYAKHRIECIFWQKDYESAMNWFLREIEKQLSPRAVRRVKKIFGDPYFLAFCLIMTNYAIRLEEEKSDEIIDFIFDEQGKVGKRAVEWWQRMNKIIPTVYYRKHLPNEPIHRNDKLFLPLQAADLLAWQTRRRLEEFNIRGMEAKRPEYEMLEAVPLYPNRWDKEQLRPFLEKLLTPVPGESALYRF